MTRACLSPRSLSSSRPPTGLRPLRWSAKRSPPTSIPPRSARSTPDSPPLPPLPHLPSPWAKRCGRRRRWSSWVNPARASPPPCSSSASAWPAPRRTGPGRNWNWGKRAFPSSFPSPPWPTPWLPGRRKHWWTCWPERCADASRNAPRSRPAPWSSAGARRRGWRCSWTGWTRWRRSGAG